MFTSEEKRNYLDFIIVSANFSTNTKKFIISNLCLDNSSDNRSDFDKWLEKCFLEIEQLHISDTDIANEIKEKIPKIKKFLRVKGRK